MRTLFITPLLWKRFDRAARRRGEEGQALVLIALVAIAIVAMVGLAIDGGLGYLEATELQRAADAAALSGVPWVPENRDIADARAQLSAESNGVKVACFYDTASPSSSAYNQRCRRVSYDALTKSNSGADLYYYESSQPPNQSLRFSVRLGKMQPRFFLGVIGFPEYPIVRTATAEYSRLVRFGSSFNYYGTNGVLYDHYMRCDLVNLNDCGGNVNTSLIMQGATYQKYVLMRCEQPNPPTPCVGGFWGHIAGPNLNHINGDAYNPIRDGAGGTSGSNPLGGPIITGDASLSQNCLSLSDPGTSTQRGTWFVTQVFGAPGSSGCPKTSGSYPVRNFDYHPDSPGQQGFGYEIAIDVDKSAIFSYSDTVSNTANHTNLNITIYDGAIAELGAETFGTSDNFQPNGGYYARMPYETFTTQNALTNTNKPWFTKEFICSPGSVYPNDVCKRGAQPPANAAYATPPRDTITNITDVDQKGNINTRFPDPNNIEYTYNDMRTRLSLFAPASLPTIPPTYANVSGNLVGSFELTDMSVRRKGTSSIDDEKIGGWADFCYVIFDDDKAFWDNTRVKPGNTALDRSPYPGPYSASTGGPGLGPDYAYDPVTKLPQPKYARYGYVCPQFTDTANAANNKTADFRWNQLRGTPTARYGTSTQFTNDKTIQDNILGTSPGYAFDIKNSPIVTGTLDTATGTATYDQINPETQNVASIWSPARGNFKHVSDTSQDCRRSAIDRDGWPLDPLWGHNRLPFNMAYGDPLVNRAWITDTAWVGQTKTGGVPVQPVADQKIAGYYTLYYSFHGWRCDWDFDSNYTFNPRQNPASTDRTMTGNPSLSYKERELFAGSGQEGKYDKAFVLGHPGLSSNKYLRAILDNQGATAARVTRELIPVGKSDLVGGGSLGDGTYGDGLNLEMGLQPYFHLTNITWNGNGIGAVPNKNDNTAPMRAGTYMMQVQAFGGAGANRYSVKAEYENPRLVDYLLGDGKTIRVTPVPNVYAITAMAIYANAVNSGTNTQQKVIFDLAYIPPQNAGTQAVLEIFDTGDVSGDLAIQVLEPSRWGPRINTKNASQPFDASSKTWNWEVPLGNPIKTRIVGCPYSYDPGSIGINASCYTNSLAAPADIQPVRAGGKSYYNDQWILMSFTIPRAGDFDQWRKDCATVGVPENLCFYFQVNYQLSGAGAQANDTTTWQLRVQAQPVHLVLD